MTHFVRTLVARLTLAALAMLAALCPGPAWGQRPASAAPGEPSDTASSQVPSPNAASPNAASPNAASPNTVSPAAGFPVPARGDVVLLVHGMKLKVDTPTQVWGTRAEQADDDAAPQWTGLLGGLTRAGWRYGGTLRARGGSVELPAGLDTVGVVGDPREATLFVFEYSGAANVDGLAYQALEVADALASLRRFTNCRRVRVVAHSAGGMAVRAYLQGALPRVPYQGEVDRLVTIGTPHLGCELAEHLGDFVGPRATSLRPESALLERMNNDLTLPADVRFACVVIRGVQVGNRGLRWAPDRYLGYLDPARMERLPLDYRLGGDQLVHVCSQNLALARCAARYELLTRQPVVARLVRVMDPTPDDWRPLDTTVHEVAPADGEVTRIVSELLANDSPAWSPRTPAQLAELAQRHARQLAFGLIEDATARAQSWSEPRDTRIDRLEPTSHTGRTWRYHVEGASLARHRLLGLTFTTNYKGWLEFTLDEFGRVASSRSGE